MPFDKFKKPAIIFENYISYFCAQKIFNKELGYVT